MNKCSCIYDHICILNKLLTSLDKLLISKTFSVLTILIVCFLTFLGVELIIQDAKERNKIRDSYRSFVEESRNLYVIENARMTIGEKNRVEKKHPKAVEPSKEVNSTVESDIKNLEKSSKGKIVGSFVGLNTSK